MTYTPGRARRRALVKLGTLAGTAQVVASLSNVIVGVIIARELGGVVLGQFSFLFVVLILFVAVQTAWVGDGLAVLPKNERMRRGLEATQWLHVLAALLIAPFAAVMVVHLRVEIAVLFGLATAAWEIEEFTRRALMARLAFGRQLIADGSYLVISTGGLVVFILAGTLSLGSVLFVIFLAAIGSALIGLLLLPSSDRLRIPRLRTDGISDVARFGAWRAAQSGSGYLAQASFRYCVILSGSLAVLGSLEAARIIVAPLFILFAAANNVLLPAFARRSRPIGARAVLHGAGVLLATSVVYAGVVIVGSRLAAEVLYANAVDVPRAALFAWLAVAGSVAIVTPYSAAAVAREESRLVFYARLLGASFGLVLAVAIAISGHPLFAPAGLALGNLLSAAILYHADNAAEKVRNVGTAFPNTTSVVEQQ